MYFVKIRVPTIWEAQLNGSIWIRICNPEAWIQYYDMYQRLICNKVFFVQLNDYLVTGTRQQYWEELFVKHIMEVRTTHGQYLIDTVRVSIFSSRVRNPILIFVPGGSRIPNNFFFPCSKPFFFPCSEPFFLPVFEIIFSSRVRDQFFFLCPKPFFLPVFETIFSSRVRNHFSSRVRNHFFFTCSKQIFLPVFETNFSSRIREQLFLTVFENFFSSRVRNLFFFPCSKPCFLPVFETIFTPCSKPNIDTFCQVPASLFLLLASELYSADQFFFGKISLSWVFKVVDTTCWFY